MWCRAALAVSIRTDAFKVVRGLEELAGDVIVKSNGDALGVVGQRRGSIGPGEHGAVGDEVIRVELLGVLQGGACARRHGTGNFVDK